MEIGKKYYEVIAKCGHVGRKHYVPIKFAVEATNGREAARIVRDFPRVKHNHKDAILDVKRIDYELYQEILETNKNDPYLYCHSKQEQRELVKDLSTRIQIDLQNQEIKHDKKARLERIAYKMKKSKIIERTSRGHRYYVYSN